MHMANSEEIYMICELNWKYMGEKGTCIVNNDENWAISWENGKMIRIWIDKAGKMRKKKTQIRVLLFMEDGISIKEIIKENKSTKDVQIYNVQLQL